MYRQCLRVCTTAGFHYCFLLPDSVVSKFDAGNKVKGGKQGTT